MYGSPDFRVHARVRVRRDGIRARHEREIGHAHARRLQLRFERLEARRIGGGM